ncbi:MAG: MtrB/PioB family outer membrane beta-barrel protein [Planctomycetes bacterium]|nr:MtrB/PioB family outer membrane beta-barrel protein [Planctomycetota bacterium]
MRFAWMLGGMLAATALAPLPLARAQDGAPNPQDAPPAAAAPAAPAPAAPAAPAAPVTPAPAPAAEAKKPAPKAAGSDGSMFDILTGSVEIRGQGTSNLDKASRFLEYRDEPTGPVAPWIEVATRSRPDDDYYFSATMKDAAQDDTNAGFEFGRYGVFSVTFGYNRILHRYGSGAYSLYGGVGTNRLTLPDALQASLQAAGTVAAGRNLLAAANVAARDVDDELRVERDILKMTISYVEIPGVRLYTDLRYEDRDGAKPVAGSFGHGNFDEIAEPRSHHIFSAETGAVYACDAFDARAYYRFSSFDNLNASVEWDNFFRATDAATSTGQSRGRIALAPDHLAHTVGFQAGVNLPLRTRINAEASSEWRTADNDLLPYTINTATNLPAALGGAKANLTSSLPQESFEGRINTQVYSVVATSRPLDPLDLKAVARMRQQNDDSERIDFPGYVQYDGTFRTLGIENERYEFDKMTGSFDAGYRVSECRTRFSGGYQYDRYDRDERDVERVEEHTVRVGAETKWCGAIKTSFGYSQSWRLRGTLDAPVPNEFPNLGRYDWTSRDRQKPSARVNVTPCDWAEIAIQYSYLLDNYDTEFGLRDAKGHEVSLDLDLNPCDRIALSPYGAYSNYTFDQKNRQGASSGINSPYAGFGDSSFSNWTAVDTGDSITFGITSMFVVVKERLKLSTDYTWAYNRSDIHLDSPLGPSSATDLNFRVLQSMMDAQNSERSTVNVRWDYTPSKRFTLSLGYTYDSYDAKVSFDEGLTGVPASSSGGFFGYFMTQEYENTDVHLFFLSATYKF